MINYELRHFMDLIALEKYSTNLYLDTYLGSFLEFYEP